MARPRFTLLARRAMFLDRGADFHQDGVRGWTPIHIACQYDRVDVLQLCIDRGADVDRPTQTTGVTPLYVACCNGRTDAARICLNGGAEVDRASEDDVTPLMISCITGFIDAARLCLERGADIKRVAARGPASGETPYAAANIEGHVVMTAWLGRIQVAGWARHLAEPRYKLVVLKELVARGRARRQRAFFGTERMLDLLFAGGQPNTRAKRGQPRLPDELFSIIAQYYWGGGLSAEEEAAAAAEAAARQNRWAEEAPEPEESADDH
mmetsp:Transcript_27706/g.85657  ORF Transcript_27706/g.85657 Transcript_27706/m.85657 type:complete len:267 (-) Transcript_27706:105-905(-)